MSAWVRIIVHMFDSPVTAATPRVVEPSRSGLPVEEASALADVIESTEREIARLQARQLVAVNALRLVYAGTSMAGLVSTEVALTLMISDGAAQGRWCLAESLATRFTATLEALGRGEIDLYKARSIVEVAAADAVLVEAAALAVATDRTGTQLRAVLRRAVHTIDSDGAERRHAAAVEDRRVVRTPGDDGMSQLCGELSFD